ncbi:ferredoxin [uncultured Shimia sp.]|uniref:ferredoxin n=1 Tax=uncultured Shimia sp. TaxID=573152 RepID=UPI0025D14D80|nr:ferredoxin [uncultured Shimia sp.]
MTLDAIQTAAANAGLLTLGALHEDGKTIVLFGTGPEFWAAFSASPEHLDGEKHPIDRWSKSIVGGLAQTFSGTCQFPSDGPPYPPFIRWALDSGQFFQSPVGMMVHPDVGLMISLRGALILPREIPLPQQDTPSPCLTCHAPCTSACPVEALSAETGYNVVACHAFLDTEDGAECMARGCIARRACPHSAKSGRTDAQSDLHMRSFHP